MRSSKREFLSVFARGSTGIAAGVTQFFMPEVKATSFQCSNAAAPIVLPPQSSWRMSEMDGDLEWALYNQAIADPEVIELKSLSSNVLSEAGPIETKHIDGPETLSLDLIQIPYKEAASRDTLATVLLYGNLTFGRADTGYRTFSVKFMVYRDGRVLGRHPIINVIEPFAIADLGDQLHKSFFPETAPKVIGHGRKTQQAPCVPIDCGTLCETACFIFGAATASSGVMARLGPITITRGASVITIHPGVFIATAGGFAGACGNCQYECRDYNYHCCRVLREAGLLDPLSD